MHLDWIELLSLLSTGAWLSWRYVLVPMLSQAIGGWLKQRLIHTDHELIIWLHHKKKMQGLGHAYKTVVECPQDDCAKIGPNST